MFIQRFIEVTRFKRVHEHEFSTAVPRMLRSRSVRREHGTRTKCLIFEYFMYNCERGETGGFEFVRTGPKAEREREREKRLHFIGDVTNIYGLHEVLRYRFIFRCCTISFNRVPTRDPLRPKVITKEKYPRTPVRPTPKPFIQFTHDFPAIAVKSR